MCLRRGLRHDLEVWQEEDLQGIVCSCEEEETPRCRTRMFRLLDD